MLHGGTICVKSQVGQGSSFTTLVRHAGYDQAEAGPGVEPLMDQVQLARTVTHQDGGERGAEAADAGVEVHPDSLGAAENQGAADDQADREELGPRKGLLQEQEAD